MPTFQQVCGHKECAVFDLCNTSAARHARGHIEEHVTYIPWYPDEEAFGMRSENDTLMRGFCCVRFKSTGALKVPSLARIIELSGMFHSSLPSLEEIEERVSRYMADPCSSQFHKEVLRIIKLYEEVDKEVLAGGDLALDRLVKLVAPQREPHMPRTDDDYPLP